MHRTVDDDWQTVYRRIQNEKRLQTTRSSRGAWRAPAGVGQGAQSKSAPRMGGVLLLSRRRQQERLIGLLLLVLLVCSVMGSATYVAVFWGAGRVQAARQPALAAEPTAVNSPVPVSAIPQVVSPEYQRTFHILLLGSDQREDDPGFRTDVILLVTLDPINNRASAVSFPRDLWVTPPNLYPMKINMVQALGGFDALAETFESGFDVRPDFYVLVNFRGFTDLIDRLGGIEVLAGDSLTDSCDLPQEPDGVCTVEPGPVQMDGATALWYVRSRHTSSDYDRLRRAQEVVQAVFQRAMHLDALARAPQLYTEFRQDLETNLTPGDIVGLAPLAVRLFQEPQRISRYVINENQAAPAWSLDGLWILLPDYAAIRSVLDQAGVYPQATGP